MTTPCIILLTGVGTGQGVHGGGGQMTMDNRPSPCCHQFLFFLSDRLLFLAEEAIDIFMCQISGLCPVSDD